jgi:hypothetical protein
MLRHELRRESGDRLRVREHRERVVLGLVPGPAGPTLHHERAFARRAPVRRTLEADAPVQDLFKLVEDLPELGQALCATVAGGCGDAVTQRHSRNTERCSSNSWRTCGNSDRRSARPWPADAVTQTLTPMGEGEPIEIGRDSGDTATRKRFVTRKTPPALEPFLFEMRALADELVEHPKR